jgi:hypothetical protein
LINSIILIYICSLYEGGESSGEAGKSDRVERERRAPEGQSPPVPTPLLIAMLLAPDRLCPTLSSLPPKDCPLPPACASPAAPKAAEKRSYAPPPPPSNPPTPPPPIRGRALYAREDESALFSARPTETLLLKCPPHPSASPPLAVLRALPSRPSVMEGRVREDERVEGRGSLLARSRPLYIFTLSMCVCVCVCVCARACVRVCRNMSKVAQGKVADTCLYYTADETRTKDGEQGQASNGWR